MAFLVFFLNLWDLQEKRLPATRKNVQHRQRGTVAGGQFWYPSWHVPWQMIYSRRKVCWQPSQHLLLDLCENENVLAFWKVKVKVNFDIVPPLVGKRERIFEFWRTQSMHVQQKHGNPFPTTNVNCFFSKRRPTPFPKGSWKHIQNPEILCLFKPRIISNVHSVFESEGKTCRRMIVWIYKTQPQTLRE